METKLFEVRDRGTFMPVICIKLQPGNEADRYLLAIAGYGLTQKKQSEYILYGKVAGGNFMCSVTEHDYGFRSGPISHQHIQKHWDELTSGDVIDVEFILGETEAPKISQRHDTKL